MASDYLNDVLCVDGVALPEVAENFGTPAFVYSAQTIAANWCAYDDAFGDRAHQISYAVKANSNLAVLGQLAALGSGFDVVSGGELQRLLAIGCDPGRVVFSGVGKSIQELELAVSCGVGSINLESREEALRLSEVAAAHGVRPEVSIRVNPDVDPKTHPYISTGLKENKFGLPIDEARALYLELQQSEILRPTGVACHIGSQLLDASPVRDAVEILVELVAELRAAGIAITRVDAGGGLGIAYGDEAPPSIGDYVAGLCEKIPADLAIEIEPGRSIVGKAGLLITRVEYVKKSEQKTFFIVDAAMSELLRPTLYNATHKVMAVRQARRGAEHFVGDVVGPVCESGDWLARNVSLAVNSGALLAICDVGAYGFVMSSNYNSRPRPPEILLDNGAARLIRSRESHGNLLLDELELFKTHQ